MQQHAIMKHTEINSENVYGYGMIDAAFIVD